MTAFSTSTLIRPLGMALAALLFATAACGGGDGGSDSTTTATSPPTTNSAAAEGPGVISVTSSAIKGQSGKMLLAYAMPPGGGEHLARLCAGIDSDSFTLSDDVMTNVPAGNDPCGGDTVETVFDQGTYDLVIGVYVPGQQSPEAETTVTVKVAGDTTAEIDGAALSN